MIKPIKCEVLAQTGDRFMLKNVKVLSVEYTNSLTSADISSQLLPSLVDTGKSDVVKEEIWEPGKKIEVAIDRDIKDQIMLEYCVYIREK
jgi:hypothetical protein